MQGLKILAPNEPSVGLTERFCSMHRALTVTRTCPVLVPVLFYFPLYSWEPQQFQPSLPYLLVWYQFSPRKFMALRPRRPRRDSLFLANSRCVNVLLAKFFGAEVLSAVQRDHGPMSNPEVAIRSLNSAMEPV